MIRICLLAIAVAASGPALTNDLTVNATNPGDVGGNNGGAASVAINTYGSDGHAYRGAGVPGSIDLHASIISPTTPTASAFVLAEK